jgi:hypothetical protein
MAGTPKKRARAEGAQAAGATPTWKNTVVEGYRQRSHASTQKKYEVVTRLEDGKEVPYVIEKKDRRHDLPGAPPEHMAAMRAKKFQMAAEGNKDALGGRAKRKFTRAEITERALERLEPVALKVLAEQVKNERLDPSDRRAAAIKILEYRRGKPQQAIKVDSNQVTTIRFETAAWVPGMEHASSASLESGETLELPPGDFEELADSD